MKTRSTVAEVLARIPGPATAEWPMGERFAVALAHGTMSVEYYAPIGHDPQTPHDQDEVYFVHQGSGTLVVEGERHPFEAGDCLFVAAHAEHRFEDFSRDFGTWVVFWGPKGGEKPDGA
ncbi:cupin domain-containing protein [Nitrosovibrio sp. Nv17]|uniref:cupin domain-containing protein n=1 Tax=Nitrosovibrio sp. Nv17 TaxID=1855339 RepID=UPI0009089CF3|nr:cupin domain-containing protein [Nitrosovibrio sp. Nv17]SFW11773.1 Cupin domain-containing protein [Nitrosovibrio sp. Nv17]